MFIQVEHKFLDQIFARVYFIIFNFVFINSSSRIRSFSLDAVEGLSLNGKNIRVSLLSVCKHLSSSVNRQK